MCGCRWIIPPPTCLCQMCRCPSRHLNHFPTNCFPSRHLILLRVSKIIFPQLTHPCCPGCFFRTWEISFVFSVCTQTHNHLCLNADLRLCNNSAYLRRQVYWWISPSRANWVSRTCTKLKCQQFRLSYALERYPYWLGGRYVKPCGNFHCPARLTHSWKVWCSVLDVEPHWRWAPVARRHQTPGIRPDSIFVGILLCAYGVETIFWS